MHPPCRNPAHCLVPDFVLREVAKRGGKAEREIALGTLGVSATLRSARTQAEARRAAIGPPRSPTAALRVPKVSRVIRDAGGGEDLDSAVVRTEGDPDTGDPAVDEAFEYFGATWDFFFEVFARDSIDGAGMTLDGVVHYGQNFDNAFWDGDQMVFGDGSGRLFTRLTQSLSVCAHELGHGVIQYDGPLVYQGQSGALNEHVADAFGAMVDQWRHGETVDEADWLVGKEILGEEVSGRALRSMKEPGTAYDDDLLGKDPQPGHMDDFVRTHDDNGGVHINSGIPNRAFYEIASKLGGHSWEHAGRILYAALGNPQLRPTSDFRRFARLNRGGAADIRGRQSRGRGRRGGLASGWPRALGRAPVAEAGSLAIRLRRSGGLLPGRVLETFVREQDLEPQEAKRLRAIVAAADLDRLSARSPITGPGADMYHYEVVVEADGQLRRVVVSGTQVPTELRPLVEFLEGRVRDRPQTLG